jgi:hypothetical protein
MWAAINSEDVKSPCLLNVRTTRLFWHAGAGTDNPNLPDRHKQFIEKWGNEIVLESEKIVKEAWERCLKL